MTAPESEAPAKQDEAVFEAILSDISNQMVDVAQQAVEEVVAKKTKPLVRHHMNLGPITHDPMGVGASMFGLLVFFSCVFITSLTLFVAEKPILRHLPQMAFLYDKMGFYLLAPGEGLKIKNVTAEKRLEGTDRTLVIEGKITNISEHEVRYPALSVILKNDEIDMMKEWNFKAGSAKIASGETVPIMLQLPDAPKDGTIVDIRVRDE